MEFDRCAWQQALAARDIRVAFFDVDGTLLDHHGNYSRRLQQAMAATRQAGIKTAIASGRPPYATRFLIEELDLSDAGVFFTGALVYEPATHTTLQAAPLAPTAVQAVVARARALDIYTEICTGTAYYVECRPVLSEVHSQHLRAEPVLGTFAALDPQEPVYKLLLAVDEQQQPGLLQRIEREFPELVFAYACLPAQPHWSFVSVIAAAACKRRAFQQLLEYYGVSAAQTLAFGDADSDRDFLTLAGLGVAMGNARPEIQAIADRVTLSAAADGVAHVLEVLVETR